MDGAAGDAWIYGERVAIHPAGSRTEKSPFLREVSTFSNTSVSTPPLPVIDTICLAIVSPASLE